MMMYVFLRLDKLCLYSSLHDVRLGNLEKPSICHVRMTDNKDPPKDALTLDVACVQPPRSPNSLLKWTLRQFVE